ncbi:MAG: hypothetical protein ACFCVA_11010 [Gammaproteobacteria bacterium]
MPNRRGRLGAGAQVEWKGEKGSDPFFLLSLPTPFPFLASLRLIVLDPLQPLCALDLNVPENA